MPIQMTPVDMKAFHLPSLSQVIGKITAIAKRGEKIFGLWPSNARTCRRQLFYLKKKYPEDNPAGWRLGLIMEIGNLFEAFIIEKLKNAGKEFGLDIHSQQFRVTVPIKFVHPTTGELIKLDIRGKVDVLMGNHIIVEIKSTNRYTVDEIMDGDSPREDHYAQTHLYFPGMEEYKEAGFDPKAIWLIYMSRDDERIKGFEYGFDKSDFDETVQRFVDVEVAFAIDQVPARDFKISQWQCQYCPMLNRCWGVDAEDGLVEHIVDLPWMEPIVLELQEAKKWEKCMSTIIDELELHVRKGFADHKTRFIAAGIRMAMLERSEQDRLDTQKLPPEIKKEYVKTIVIEKMRFKNRIPGALTP